MKHEVLFLGKTKDSFIQDGIQEYASRLQHYTTFSIKTIKEKGKGRNSSSIETQGALLIKAVPAGSFTVVLDSRGKQYSSDAFAKKISEWEMLGIKQIQYLIGGPEGHSPEVIRQADILLSLSKMTFTHDMVRMLLVEQLYRAYTIKAGEGYHK